MKYSLSVTNKFKKTVKLARKRGLNIHLLNNIVDTLQKGEELDEKYCDHALSGDYIGYRECHIQPDWLLIYRVNDDALILTLVATGTHADLFKR